MASGGQILGITMICIRTGITQEHLSQVYSDERINNALAQDNRAIAPVNHPLATYLSCFINELFVGAFLAIRNSIYEFEIHSLLLKKAGRNAGKLISMLIDWCFDHTDVMRITAKILEPLQSVVNLAKRFKFQYEGFMRSVTTIKGNPAGLHIMGLTKWDL